VPCSPGWPGTSYEAQIGPEFAILLPQPLSQVFVTTPSISGRDFLLLLLRWSFPDFFPGLASQTSILPISTSWVAVIIFFFFGWTWVWTQVQTTWATPPALSVKVFIFWDTLSQTICPGWLWTTILLISASWVARITGVSHWPPAL
jgi:hypothetical protein